MSIGLGREELFKMGGFLPGVQRMTESNALECIGVQMHFMELAH